MHAPSSHEILLAEQRLMQVRRGLARDGVRLKTAVHAALSRPSTLLGVAGAAGLAGYLMFRPPHVRVEHTTTSGAATAAVASTSMAGIIVAFAMRYAMQRLPGIGVQLVERAMRRARSDAGPVDPRTQFRSAGTLH
jgi:hypothetical protein